MGADLFLPLTISGLVVGIMYALLGVGLVVAYRTSNTLNFAHGAMGMFASYVFFKTLLPRYGLALALPMVLLIAAGMGVLLHRFVIRHLEGQPTLAKVIATIGTMIALQSAAVIIWGEGKRPVRSIFPNRTAFEVANVAIGIDQLAMAAILGGVVLGLTWFFTRSRLGVAVRAVANSQRDSMLLGIDAHLVTGLGWGIAGVLAALAGILLSPLVYLDTVFLTLMLIPAYGAALLGRLRSVHLTVLGGLLIGVLQSLSGYVSDSPGFAQVLPFVVIVAALMLQPPEQRAAGEVL